MSEQDPGPFTSEILLRGAAWLSGGGSDADVVVSSRVRLARNLAGFRFVCRADRQQRQQVLNVCRERLLRLASSSKVIERGGRLLWVDVHRAPQLERTLMVERHLISKEHARGPAAFIPSLGQTAPAKAGGQSSASSGANGEPRGVAITMPDESLSVMVNEEDHLRIQVLLSGLELTTAYEQIARVDNELEGPCTTAAGRVEFAYSQRFGYLTACPTNVGTGIRVSVMLHLPGLKLTGEMDKVRRATRDMSLAVRGYYGEGSEAAGEFFQVSNQTTLGKPETAILRELEGEIIPQIVHYERAARRVLLERRRRLLEDKVFRALGALRHARLLTPEEAIMLLSDVRLGVLTGLIDGLTESRVNQLILLTQPAHLQRAIGREMDQGERREARADLVRERLSV
ncbi:MAG: protein arginine kinase [Phycisphaeraceae bacterium]|nr:protein arginine kinase [Phycisphaeraceae bacterium]